MDTEKLRENVSTAGKVHGIRLYRRDGKPRRNFSESERLTLLGNHEWELDEFLRLFAPRQYPYIRQREVPGEGRQWQTVHHRLTRDNVAKHLLADFLPGVSPTWVGTQAWENTAFVAIDVDYRGDEEDFRERCQPVENALLTLGIPKTSLLLQKTPSGGCHYYFFPYEPIPTAEIEPVLEKVGLKHINGQHEIFPSETLRFRLPFGHIPGEEHDPDAWWKFMHRYESNEFPRVNWKRCCRRAESFARRQQEMTECATPSSPGRGCVSRTVERQRTAGTRNGSLSRLGKFVDSGEIAELLKKGIPCEGTRVEITKKLAWHLVFVRRMTADEASAWLTDWVYRTGSATSATVRADLARGTRKAKRQTRDIVNWCVARRNEGKYRGTGIFSRSEVDFFVDLVMNSPVGERAARIYFAMSFLNFAKKNGCKGRDGWTCCPSVRGVIRKWNGCSGMRYKPYMDWALEVGLIEMVREKWQPKGRKGRARTYLVCIPSQTTEKSTLGRVDIHIA